MKKFFKDERIGAEQSRISVVSLILIACVTAISLTIKAFYIELSFFNYGAEFLTLGFCVAYGVILSIFLFRSKRLDERSKLILGRTATIFYGSIMLCFIGVLIAMMFDELSNNVVIPYTCSCVIATSICRIIMSRTISRKAVELEYRGYKKRIIKYSILASIIVVMTTIVLAVIAAVLKNAILLFVSMTIIWIGIPTIILTDVACLRGKKYYDESTTD